MQRQLIPRGLRIQVTPSFPVDDEEFVKNWEEICNGTSRKLMELLIKLNLGILTKIDDLLDETFTKAKAILTPEQIQTINVQMDKNIDQWVKDIQTKQSSKLMRDQKDFSGGNVYRWRRHHPKESLRDGTPSASSNLPLCDVSGTSSSVFSMVSTGSTPKRKREPRYVPAKKPYGYTNENSGNNLKVINLSSHELSLTEIDILGRGLMFCPRANFDHFTAVKDLHLFARKLVFKKFFHNESLLQMFPTEAEQETLAILHELAQENEPQEVFQSLLTLFP
ncbi:uncharacterized protein LOC143776202 [Ranitomeya variabilis]